ncbi:glycoside hydrolase family 93 protein [Amylocarpus encephaloides]|uniref:Glycoside hydrolase family 93 protein n=1 Tax=Amylocarpus encephaloides TaxID=45428 RepID=A0A9P7YDI7_9HELO|nr:glycoside hydrolase family 93 protein [Amylocarpus encephaloides]
MHPFFFQAVALLCGAVLGTPREKPFTTLSGVTIFTPPSNYTNPRVLYSRTVELEGGVLLATWENYSPEPPKVYFPIFKSADGGATWKEISRVQDTQNGWGLRYQPHLYMLTKRVGRFKPGTIICSGSSIPTDLSVAQIDVYVSEDNGYTWKFTSHVATGGAAIPNNGVPAIWEPFVMEYNGKVVLYYSDQRDAAHGQKLIHTVSKDLLTWSADVDDVAWPVYTARPGMTTITQLPNKKYMMTYEYGGGQTSGGYAFPVHYRISANPLKFNDSPDFAIISNDGIQPTGSPTITWSSVGGENGTIVVTAHSNSQVFVNQALGDPGRWETVATPQERAYTRHVRILKNQNLLLIMGAGQLPPSTTNKVTVSVMDLKAALKSST